MDDALAPPLALERIEVPNGGFMADEATNAVIVGTRDVFVIDPGSERGVEAIQAALARRGNVRVKAIVLTHAHPDHATAAAPLKRLLNAPVMLNPKERPILRQFLDWSDIDEELTGDMTLSLEDGGLETIDTPGHSPGHVALFEPGSRTLIAGDLVSGNGTVGIFPPHGKMTEYLDSLRRAERLHADVVIPGHGPVLRDPATLFTYYIERRLTREREILDVVTRQPATIDAIVTELYPDVLPQIRRAAAATVLAHLEKLHDEAKVASESDDRMDGLWYAQANK